MEGDQNQLPEQWGLRPITTYDRHYPTLGVVAWDVVCEQLVFNFVPGIFTEGWPVIVKLSKQQFFDLTAGTMIEFNDEGDKAEYRRQGTITGPPATRLYTHLERLVELHAKKWNRVFPPEHHPDTPVKIKKRIR